MRYAVIENGTVTNVIVWDGETELNLGGELVNLDGIIAGPGWSYNGTTFIAPPEPEVTE